MKESFPVWFWIIFSLAIVVGIIEISAVMNSDLPTWAKFVILTR